MILQRLAEHYDRIAASSDAEGKLAPPGFSQQKISFCVVLEPDGRLDAIQSMQQLKGRALVATPMLLPDAKKADELTKWMCTNFFDIRTFGAVMSTSVNCGQVRGPLQLTFSRSIDPVVSAEFAIIWCAVTKEGEKKEREMGRTFNVPYGLYRCHGFVNANLAEKTGFSEEDLALLKNALNNMFETDRSAARGLMSPVRCIAFSHRDKCGNARADRLFSRVTAKLRDEMQAQGRPARSASDYVIAFKGELPEHVTQEEWVVPF